MSVEGVNSANNNAGIYTAGAALIGGAGGAAAGWYSKPFLKDGAPTDTFIKKMEQNIVNILPPEEKKAYEASKNVSKELEKVSNLDELKALVKNNDLIKQAYDCLGIPLDDIIAEMDAKGFDASVAEIKKGIGSGLELNKELFNAMFESAWDKNSKKFVHNAEEIKKEAFNAVKKAAHGIQGKTAAIYGGISAAVLGLATYLIANNSKKSE